MVMDGWMDGWIGGGSSRQIRLEVRCSPSSVRKKADWLCNGAVIDYRCAVRCPLHVSDSPSFHVMHVTGLAILNGQVLAMFAGKSSGLQGERTLNKETSLFSICNRSHVYVSILLASFFPRTAHPLCCAVIIQLQSHGSCL